MMSRSWIIRSSTTLTSVPRGGGALARRRVGRQPDGLDEGGGEDVFEEPHDRVEPLDVAHLEDRSFFAARATRASASCVVAAIGFSTSRCRPRSSAGMPTSKCRSVRNGHAGGFVRLVNLDGWQKRGAARAAISAARGVVACRRRRRTARRRYFGVIRADAVRGSPTPDNPNLQFRSHVFSRGLRRDLVSGRVPPWHHAHVHTVDHLDDLLAFQQDGAAGLHGEGRRLGLPQHLRRVEPMTGMSNRMSWPCLATLTMTMPGPPSRAAPMVSSVPSNASTARIVALLR